MPTITHLASAFSLSLSLYVRLRKLSRISINKFRTRASVFSLSRNCIVGSASTVNPSNCNDSACRIARRFLSHFVGRPKVVPLTLTAQLPTRGFFSRKLYLRRFNSLSFFRPQSRRAKAVLIPSFNNACAFSRSSVDTIFML